MFSPSNTPAPPLPRTDTTSVRPGMSLLKPLSRRGHGPGLILLCPDTSDSVAIKDGVPSPLVKWAEEGYAVVEIQARAIGDGIGALRDAIKALSECDACDSKMDIGLISYNAKLWNVVAESLSSFKNVVSAVVYADASETDSIAVGPVPLMQHLGGPTSSKKAMIRTETLTCYFYPRTKSYLFSTPFQGDFDYAAEAVSHTRNLSFMKPIMRGPYFDLENIWEEHTFYEFEDRSVEHTMSTMVQEPYVNHIPTLTGGVGRQRLTSFYRDHFIFNNSSDTELELVSRTIGIDRVIDEFVYKFTHDSFVDWMLPGIPPTGKKVEIPFTAVVNIRGDRLYHEHIAWDQGTVLSQLGLLPEYLPFPYPVPGDSAPGKGRNYEYRLPVAGIESASKLREKNSAPSNEMFSYGVRECD